MRDALQASSGGEESIASVLAFWFGHAPQDVLACAQQRDLWWGQDARVDALVARRFGGLIVAAQLGQLDHWATRPEGRLALIILTDQLARRAFRASTRAYACEGLAWRWCVEGLAQDVMARLRPVEQCFFILPLAQVEALGDQERCVTLMTALIARQPATEQASWQPFLALVRERHALVQRFGRFPERNRILGRADRPLEAEYLAGLGHMSTEVRLPPGTVLLILDFDGTLADSMTWFLAQINDMARLYRFRPVPAETVPELRRLTAADIIGRLCCARWKLPLIAAHLRWRMRSAAVQPFPGVVAALENLRAHGFRLALLSSNAQGNVQRILGARACAAIDDWCCGIGLFGKRRALRRVLRRTGVAPQAAVCIGDERRDGEAALAEGVPFMGVAWGYNTPEVLLPLANCGILPSPEALGALALPTGSSELPQASDLRRQHGM